MSLRPNNPKRIQTSDLLPGDILLSCGPASDPLDSLIKLVDQGDYSHTSVFIGVDNSGSPRVVEATKEGIKNDDISIDLEAQVLVDAYRYMSPDGHTLGMPDWPAQPILDQALSYVGANYSYDRLVLGAVVLLAANKSSTNPDLDALVRLGLILLEQGLESYMSGVHSSGKIPMTCVEVATAAFWQATATPPNKYGLQVQMVRSAPPMASGDAAAASVSSMARPGTGAASADAKAKWPSVRDRVASALAAGHPRLAANLAGAPKMSESTDATGVGLILTAGSPYLDAGMCTPRDMETSPTLKFLGCLQDKSAAQG